MQLIVLSAALTAMLAPAMAFAYTGPGLGLGAIVTVLSVIFSSILAVLALIWYPIKRLFRQFRAKSSRADAADAPRETPEA